MHIKRHTSRGVTLTEVLITMVMFSIGPLALAKMQLLTQQGNHLTVLRTVAFNQAYNLAEQLHLGVRGRNLNQVMTTWNNSNAQLLPEGNGEVVQHDNAYTITVYWQGPMGQSYCHVDSSQSCAQVKVWI